MRRVFTRLSSDGTQAIRRVSSSLVLYCIRRWSEGIWFAGTMIF
jgi:hypothetical protein